MKRITEDHGGAVVFPATHSSRRIPLTVILLLGVASVPAPAQNPTLDGVADLPAWRNPDSWLNTDHPLPPTELRGQVVLLDFWTYCCINCMHVLADTKYLEDKYRDQPLVVIGVHSGKFDEEKDPQNIRNAVLRLNIHHPVVVDSDYKLWNYFGVRAWPSLVLIDPTGRSVIGYSGEGHRAEIDRAIGNMLERFRNSGELAAPLHFQLEREARTPAALDFPGKVLADATGHRLFISDTNHHRILVCDLSGRVSQVIGSGNVGRSDGPLATACFHQPQGLALSADGRTLYVADTENHALRAADLTKARVTTLAGNGQPARSGDRGGLGTQARLSSPWDLALLRDQLYIAMAGTHQIWVYDLSSRRVSVLAGTGREDRVDGPNSSAAFAQPTGLATDGRRLFVADAESSSIRALEPRTDGATATIAGIGGLFDFGLRDGPGSSARFQHPLGVSIYRDKLFVADTFNGVIRLIDLASGDVSTWFGSPHNRTATQSAESLFEPGGLSATDSTLYVADTNHHRIVAIDLATRQAEVLEIRLPSPSK